MRKCESRLVQATLLDKNGIVASLSKNICTGDHCGRLFFESGKRYDKCFGIHAEERAILNALKYGHTDLHGYKMKVNFFPCRHCQALMDYYGVTWEVE